MQIVYKNEDEKGSSRRANSVDIVVCAKRIGRYLERKPVERFGEGIIRIQNSRGIFGGNQKRVWRKRRGIRKSSKIKEIRVRRKNNGRVCTRIPKSS